jgi:hypothetical protein
MIIEEKPRKESIYIVIENVVNKRQQTIYAKIDENIVIPPMHKVNSYTIVTPLKNSNLIIRTGE